MSYRSRKHLSGYESRMIIEAEGFETSAESMRKTPGPYGEEIARKYEDAGDRRKKAGDLIGAHEDYRNAMTYGFPLDPAELKKKIKDIRLDKQVRQSQLAEKVSSWTPHPAGALAIIFMIGALFFISLDFTGAVIGGISRVGNHWLGIGLFALGLVFVMFYFRRKLN